MPSQVKGVRLRTLWRRPSWVRIPLPALLYFSIPDAQFVYLRESMAVRDVPKSVSWAPFGRMVYFSSEAVWYVVLEVPFPRGG